MVSAAAAVADEIEESGEAAASAPPPRRRRKLVLALLAGLLLAGAGIAAWLLLRPANPDAVAEEERPTEFVDVPAMQVALRRGDGSAGMLKIHVMLVPGSAKPEEITPRLPLLIDRFQPFLRELRPEDLSGSAATFRIKEELLIRSNQALGQGAVRDVLIQDLMQ